MDTIKREDLIRAVKILGYDPRDVESVILTPREITVTLFERGDNGLKALNGAGVPLRRVEWCNVGA